MATQSSSSNQIEEIIIKPAKNPKKKGHLHHGPQRGNQKDFFEECRQNFLLNKTPRKLGNYYCFWYNKHYQPRIVIGPDYLFSLIELALVNGITGYFLYSTGEKNHIWLFYFGLALLILQNLSFLVTAFMNPGIVSRDLSIHSASYLNKVKILRPNLFCKKCKVVYRQGSDTEHCEDCDFCVEEFDHHCPWSSKCIAKGNMVPFKIFLTMTVLLIVYLFTGGMFIIAAGS